MNKLGHLRPNLDSPTMRVGTRTRGQHKVEVALPGDTACTAVPVFVMPNELRDTDRHFFNVDEIARDWSEFGYLRKSAVKAVLDHWREGDTVHYLTIHKPFAPYNGAWQGCIKRGKDDQRYLRPTARLKWKPTKVAS